MAEALAPLPRRRGLSLTPLIDVIFLLLLFFMLTTSFTRPAELDLTAAGPARATAGAPPAFLQLAPDALALNGRPLASLPELAATLAGLEPDAPVLVTLAPGVTAQRLVDALALLRAAGRAAVVLE